MGMDDIIIRFANIDDVDRIMAAIKDHWDSNHILALNKEFFLYVFTGEQNNINFVIAENKNTHEIAGFLGYIRYSLSQPCSISPVMWKALEEKGSFVGLKMLLFLINKDCFALVFSTGINSKTVPIYQHLRYYTGRLDHYYRIMDKESYTIAEIKNKIILPVSPSDFEMILVEDILSFCKAFGLFSPSLKERLPHKDIDYFRRRFFEHPIYNYKIFFIYLNRTKESRAFFVCREVKQFETRILRIVDFVGDEEYLAGISVPMQNLMEKNDYEYVDFYSYGISEKIMNEAGFVKLIDNDNIIPNYFDPFVRNNVDILFYLNRFNDDIRLFKADADQDHPRLNK